MSRKTRTKSKTRNNAKSRAKKATVSTVKSTDTEETVTPTVENTEKAVTSVAENTNTEKAVTSVAENTKTEKAVTSVVENTKTQKVTAPTVEPAIIKEEVAQPEPKEEIKIETPVEENQVIEQPDLGPRRSVVFIGSECYPFVKTGGLGDVMSALPKSLAKLNVDVKVILPRYKCIPWEYQEKMEYKGSFYMDLCSDGRQYYVGIISQVC